MVFSSSYLTAPSDALQRGISLYQKQGQSQVQTPIWSFTMDDLLRLLPPPNLCFQKTRRCTMSKGWCGNQINYYLESSCLHKDARILIPRTCEYVPLHGKRDVVDMIKFRILRRGDYPIITKVFIRRQEAESE